MAVESTPADHCVRQMYQRLMDVVSLLIPHAQAAESLLPTNRALDHPAVATQPHAALDSAPREAWRDAPLAQVLPQGAVVIRLVGVQLRGALSRTPALAAHRGDRVHHLQHPFPVRHVRTRERDRERDAFAVYQLMAFR